ncbi:MAG: hypothetical protein KJT03_22305 [Verrucomicrobiae bacterium]|nr:hypothetical protein [Verrucomicrobiae bacterium]
MKLLKKVALNQGKERQYPVCMYARFAKRLFTKQAIEKWFERLTRDWESKFTQDEIRAGRLLYRRGDVRELELTEDDAIIH